MISVIRNCDWIVAWDEAGDTPGHVYRCGGDVAFSDRIVQVGGHYAGPFEREIDGRGKLIIPGLVDAHCHPSLEPLYRGLREEHGLQHHYMSGLYERAVSFWPDEEGQLAAAEVAYCEMLLSGVTTACDQSFPYEGWLALAARSGLRLVIAPQYNSAAWTVDEHDNLGYKWDIEGGKRRFDEALGLIDAAARDPSARLTGLITPAQIDTCTVELLKDSMAAARERGLAITTHACQSATEFHEMVRRTGLTPIQFMAKHDLLGPNMTIGHCIFVDDHSWLHWKSARDLDLLAESGTSVAHCPVVFSRYGIALEHFGRYRRRGINIGLGTDTAPHNMFEEIRSALIMCKANAGDIHATSLSEGFDAATVGSARALMRDDIGKLASGCKADIVVVDLEEHWMRPVRDPLRSLVFHAADRAVRDVFVDGRQVVRDRVVLTMDREKALVVSAESQRHMIDGAEARHPFGRSLQAISPLSLPLG